CCDYLENTISPFTIVCFTFVFFTSSAVYDMKSSGNTMKSAYLPTSILPFTSSSNAAYAAFKVYNLIASFNDTHSSSLYVFPFIDLRFIAAYIPKKGETSTTGLSELPASCNLLFIYDLSAKYLLFSLSITALCV